MKRTLRCVVLLSLLLCAFAAAAPPQSSKPKYDAATETTFKGVVEEVKDFECPVSGTVGSHLEVRSADALVEVHLAPAAFMNDFGIVINKGDKVDVIGSRITLNGVSTVLARQVNSNNYMYTFRNEQGRPLW